jgi:ribulose-5-phosphate 4-epimerase/fuculose-1-phosphate aldolase
MMDADTRDELCAVCRRLDSRQMVSSTGGNVSARTPQGLLITPTGSSLAELSPGEIVAVGPAGPLDGGRPSKELPFHAGIYERRPDVGAVVHGHSAVAIAVAGMLEPDDDDAFPVYTAGYVMRVGRLPLLPYYGSGSSELADGIGRVLGDDGRAALLRNHGFVTAGSSLQKALDTAEELMDALRVFLFTEGRSPGLPGDALQALLARRAADATAPARRGQPPDTTGVR